VRHSSEKTYFVKGSNYPLFSIICSIQSLGMLIDNDSADTGFQAALKHGYQVTMREDSRAAEVYIKSAQRILDE